MESQYNFGGKLQKVSVTNEELPLLISTRYKNKNKSCDFNFKYPFIILFNLIYSPHSYD